ncbi:STAS domain-containing protein [Amycolatopsis sp. OK19-0408]|uniref:STAS domain-containing protein n=1 Tax=Amycolatopsis iheyensis TaxID=2945988 RepID=A0A9X2N833_9PSEU|nr:STAS domain-containing protein [Amycolatopsis iheyensis]MCR6481954.1 STAS domain-containing protein [Amycolatopsis iheyensis]
MVPQPRSADHELTATDWINTHGRMTVRVSSPAGHTVVLRVAGEVDLNTARRLDEVLQARIGTGVEEVVIDLSGVTFCSVAGLNSLLRAQLLADATGAHLTVRPGRSRAVRRLFALLPADFDGVPKVRPVG